MKRRKKIVFGVLIFLLSIFVFISCGKSSGEKAENVLDKDTIVIGMELKYPPFETKDLDGNPEGVSVMLAEALGEYLDKEVKIVDTPYASLITALETRKIDMVISSMTITEAREERVDFSDPYTTSQLMLLVNKDSEVRSIEDIDKESTVIASKIGTIGALWAKANAPKAKISNMEDEATAVLEVAQGKADIFIYDPMSVIRHHEKFPDETRVILEALPNTKGWGVAVRKGSDELVEKINGFIKNAKTDGTYEEIREKYLKEKIKEFEEYNLKFFF